MKDLLSLAICVLATGLVLLVVIFNARRAWTEPSWGYRVTVILLIVIGLAVSFLYLNNVHWHESARIKLVGFPCPVVVFVWEDDHWTDYVGGVGMLLNALTAVLAGQLPLTALFVCRRFQARRGLRDATPTRPC